MDNIDLIKSMENIAQDQREKLEACVYYREGKVSKMALENILEKDFTGVEIIISDASDNNGVSFSVSQSDINQPTFNPGCKIIMTISDVFIRDASVNVLHKVIEAAAAMILKSRVKVGQFVKDFKDMNIDLIDAIELAVELDELYLDYISDEEIDDLVKNKIIMDKYESQESVSNVIEDMETSQADKIRNMRSGVVFARSAVDMIEALLLKHNGAIIDTVAGLDYEVNSHSDHIDAIVDAHGETTTAADFKDLKDIKLEEK